MAVAVAAQASTVAVDFQVDFDILDTYSADFHGSVRCSLAREAHTGAGQRRAAGQARPVAASSTTYRALSRLT